MKIYEDKHLNKDVYVLENEKLLVKVLKDFGGKVVSIYNKELDFELLFQPTKKEYKNPSLGDSFEDYDTSGIDEMLPTIDACYYPNSYEKMNDHGDIWTQKWDYKIKENNLLTSVRCDSLKLDLEREISLEDSKIIFNYKLRNLTKQDHFYLWAFHGLMNFDDSIEFDFGNKGEIINVKDDNIYNFDYSKLGEYPDGKSFKFYFKNELKNEDENIKIYYKKQNVFVNMNFDTEINKYLGIWINKGGFKGEYNFAIEPSSGYYDSLERAYKNKKFSKIDSKDEKNWHLSIEILEGDK